MTRICAIMIAAAFSVQPLPQADGPLEPSVQNEVDHAIDLGEKWLAKFAARCSNSAVRVSCPAVRGESVSTNREERASRMLGQLGLTNGQTRVEVALKLISTQKGGGWWLVETNAAPTRLAVEILKGL